MRGEERGRRGRERGGDDSTYTMTMRQQRREKRDSHQAGSVCLQGAGSPAVVGHCGSTSDWSRATAHVEGRGCTVDQVLHHLNSIQD